MEVMSKRLLIVFSTALVYWGTSSLQAGFLADFTGNTELVVGGTNSDGVVNFAVYENTGNWEIDLGITGNVMEFNDLSGLSIGSDDTDAPYVYFYQIMNTNPFTPDDALRLLQIAKGQFDEGGYVTLGVGGGGPLAVFDESASSPGYGGIGVTPTSGPTSGWSNPSLGPAVGSPPGAGGDADPTPGNETPGYSGALLDSTPFAAGNAATFAPLQLNVLSSFYEFQFAGIPSPSTTVLRHSVVLYLTSSRAPVYRTGHLFDGFPPTSGDIPSNTPELGNFAMALAALCVGSVIFVSCKRGTKD
jgi:hypothetical protein